MGLQFRRVLVKRLPFSLAAEGLQRCGACVCLCVCVCVCVRARMVVCVCGECVCVCDIGCGRSAKGGVTFRDVKCVCV